MMSFSHLILVLLIVVLLFGAGKLPRAMGDLGKGIRNLREGISGDEDEKAGKQEVLPPEDMK